MSRWGVLALVPGAAGIAMALTLLSPFRVPALVTRLLPHQPGSASRRPRPPLVGLLAGLAEDAGRRVATALGTRDDLDRRLLLAESGLSPGEQRLRQALAALAAMAVATLAAGALRASPAAVATAALGAGAAMVVAVDVQLSSTAAAAQRRIRAELPVVAEQLAMLVSTGSSLASALARVGERSPGRMGRELTRVTNRIAHGVDDHVALREWAAALEIDALDRLVAVLTLDRRTGDLGRLVSAEASALRDDAHRDLLARLDRRAQQVWIPVTVATLVPGLVLLLVPFLAAIRSFTDL